MTDLLPRLLLVDSSRGRKVRREKRPRNDWQVRPTHSGRAATAKTAPGKIVIGRGDKYRENSVE